MKLHEITDEAQIEALRAQVDFEFRRAGKAFQALRGKPGEDLARKEMVKWTKRSQAFRALFG